MYLTAKRAPRVLLVTMLTILAVLVVAACGSSSSSSSSTRSSSASSGSSSAQFTKYQSCLKSHGVTIKTGSFRGGAGGKPPAGTGTNGKFTPPKGAKGKFTPPKGGFKGGAPAAGAGGFGGAHSKQNQAAFKACASEAPKGVQGGFRGGAGGASGAPFSSATLDKFAACVNKHGYTLPKANTSGKGAVYPKKIEANKKFQAASKNCQSLLRPSGFGSSSGSGS